MGASHQHSPQEPIAMKLFALVLAVNLVPVAAVKVSPWILAVACFFVAASYFIVRWFRVMGAVNASIALQASNRERFEP